MPNAVHAGSACTSVPATVLPVTWAVRWQEGHSPGERPYLHPPASITLTLNADVSDVWDSHNTSKYNAATLLRHESVGF